jgi:deoxyribose-phosphate aldolase
MAEEQERSANPEGFQCKFECADQLCVKMCMDRTGNVVSAGAQRLTSTLGVIPGDLTLANMIDHTLLKPDATQQEVAQLCFGTQVYFASVYVSHGGLCATLQASS